MGIALSGLTLEQKIDIFKVGYAQISAELDHAEKIENQVTVGICTLIALFAGYLIKAGGEIVRGSGARSLISTAFIVFTALGIWFLLRNADRLRNLAQCLTRIEEVFGFFDPEYYFSEFGGAIDGRTAHPEPTLFPTRALKWGSDEALFMTSPHVCTVFFFGLTASIVLFFK
jgi:hypothetical protein